MDIGRKRPFLLCFLDAHENSRVAEKEVKQDNWLATDQLYEVLLFPEPLCTEAFFLVR